MKTKKLRKGISLLTLGVVLSTSTIIASAKGNVTSTNNEVNEPVCVEKKVPNLRLGGGDSPSAAWTKKKSYYYNFTHEQLGELNSIYNSMVTSSSYSRKQTVYNASLAIAGFMPYGINVGAAYAGLFCDSYFSLVQQSSNVVNQKYMEGGTCAVYVTEYYRPASGETLICLSRY